MKSIQNYPEIEKLVNEPKRSDAEVKVKFGVLRDMYRAIARANKERGILGFTSEHWPIVNDIGMVPIVRSVAEEDFGSYGPMKSCEVSRHSGDLIWQAKMVFSHPTGDITINRSYPLAYLETRRQFEFKLP